MQLVLDELEEIPQNYVFFLDDNIIGHSRETLDRAKQLFEGIIRRGIKKYWISQSSINFADDPELLKLAARSGGRMIFLGIEAETDAQLKEANKKLNLNRGTSTYEQVFKTIQKYGIGVIAGLIFGWDTDTAESFRNRARFALRCGADSFQTSILTPLPSSRVIASSGQLSRHEKHPPRWARHLSLRATATAASCLTRVAGSSSASPKDLNPRRRNSFLLRFIVSSPVLSP